MIAPNDSVLSERESLSRLSRSGASGPLLVLVHGLGEGGFVWRSFVETFSQKYRIASVDLAGHGDAAWKPDGDYSLSGYVAEVLDLISALEERPSAIIGHSLGGSVAMSIAQASPDLARLFVIVDSGPPSDGEATSFMRDYLASAQRSFVSLDAYADWISETRPMASRSMLDDLARASLKVREDGRFVAKFDPAIVTLLDAERSSIWTPASLQRVTAKILLVRGMASSMLSARAAMAVHQSLPNSTLSIVERSGHAVMTDNPEGFAAVVAPLLMELCRVD